MKEGQCVEPIASLCVAIGRTIFEIPCHQSTISAYRPAEGKRYLQLGEWDVPEPQHLFILWVV